MGRTLEVTTPLLLSLAGLPNQTLYWHIHCGKQKNPFCIALTTSVRYGIFQGNLQCRQKSAVILAWTRSSTWLSWGAPCPRYRNKTAIILPHKKFIVLTGYMYLLTALLQKPGFTTAKNRLIDANHRKSSPTGFYGKLLVQSVRRQCNVAFMQSRCK